MQYRLTTMRANRQQLVTRVLLALVVLLASVSTASLAAPAAGHSTMHLTVGRTLPGIEPAILRDRLPSLHPAVERPDRSGRLVPVLMGILAAALAVAHSLGAGRPSSAARTRSLAHCTSLEARAPPLLQPV